MLHAAKESLSRWWNSNVCMLEQSTKFTCSAAYRRRHVTRQLFGSVPVMDSHEVIREALLPHDAMCRLKFCQLLHNSVGTSCTTNPEQIEVTESEDTVDQRVKNNVHPATTRSTVVGATVDEFCWLHYQLAVAKFSKARVWGQSSRGKYPYFWSYPNFLITLSKIGQKPALSV